MRRRPEVGLQQDERHGRCGDERRNDEILERAALAFGSSWRNLASAMTKKSFMNSLG